MVCLMKFLKLMTTASMEGSSIDVYLRRDTASITTTIASMNMHMLLKRERLVMSMKSSFSTIQSNVDMAVASYQYLINWATHTIAIIPKLTFCIVSASASTTQRLYSTITFGSPSSSSAAAASSSSPSSSAALASAKACYLALASSLISMILKKTNKTPASIVIAL